MIALFIAVLPVCLSQEEDAYYPVRQLMVDREIAKAGIKKRNGPERHAQFRGIALWTPTGRTRPISIRLSP